MAGGLRMARSRLRGIEIGGLRFAVEVPDSLAWSASGGAARHCAAPPKIADVHVAVRVGALPEVTAGGFLYRSGSHVFEVAEREEDWVVAIHGDAGLERVASFDRDFRQGEVVIASEAASRGVLPLAHPLDELLLLHRLVRSGGLMFRGELVTRGNRGLLVLGSSSPVEAPGACGARDSGDRPRVLVVPAAEGFHALACSWTGQGDSAGSRRVPLEAIHTTTAASAVSFARLDRDEAVEAVLSHAVMPFHDSIFPSAVFDAAAAITQAVTVVQLGFPRAPARRPVSWEHGDVRYAAAMPYGG